MGTPWVDGGKLYNAVALLEGGKVAGLTFKHDLPNYGVFDEKRVFAAGPLPSPMARARRVAGRADLRGYLGAGRDRRAGAAGRGNPVRAQRLAV
jgi:predicted amidohydrolase